MSHGEEDGNPTRVPLPAGQRGGPRRGRKRDQTPDYSDVFRPLPTVTADDSPVDVSVDEPEEPEQPQPSPVEAKRSEMIRRFQTLGVASDAEACETISKILNREVKASDELSEAELDKVIGQLKAGVKEGE